MKQGISIETSAAVFIYDRGENLVAATIVEADIQRDGISFVSHGFEKPARAKDMRDSLLAIKGADDVLGWLHSHSGRARCFVTPPVYHSRRSAAPLPREHREALLQEQPGRPRL